MAEKKSYPRLADNTYATRNKMFRGKMCDCIAVHLLEDRPGIFRVYLVTDHEHTAESPEFSDILEAQKAQKEFVKKITLETGISENTPIQKAVERIAEEKRQYEVLNEHEKDGYFEAKALGEALEILKEEAQASEDECWLCEKHQNFIFGLIQIIEDLITSGAPAKLQELKDEIYGKPKEKENAKQ